ncbi:MAG: carbon-nitrogen hydrolase family protein [Nakamurella sp.]
MRVTVGQFAAGTDGAANIAACAALIADAAQSGTDLVVLPEVAMYFDPKRIGELGPHGQSLDGPFATAVAEAARAHKVAVIVGMLESVESVESVHSAQSDASASGGARDFNTLIVVSATGQRLGEYRKIHLYDAFGFRESDTYLPGPVGVPPVFDIAGMRVAALTCYDLRFPEIFRWVVDAGAEVVTLPAAWIAGPGKEAHWATLLAARAIENTVYVAGAGQSGPICCGHSMVIDPMGNVLGGAGERPGVATAEVTSERIAEVRATNPSLRNRRFSVIPGTESVDTD